MRFYEENILPHLINCACGMKAVDKQRSIVVPQARGVVLEVGVGSGLNLKHYCPSLISAYYGLEPSLGMRKKAQKNIEDCAFDVEWLGLKSESIPLPDNHVDTIVVTYTLCTIADVDTALSEMARVLKQDGKFLFCEHGLTPNNKLSKWQDRINPLWKKIAGGCNLNRDIPKIISQNGFKIHQLDAGYIEGPKLAAFNYWGSASLAI